MDAKERGELVSVTQEHLADVIGASGNAGRLIELTKEIVKAAKRLIEDTPQDLQTKSTNTMAEFVEAAKAIAKDARAVDSNSLQRLSSAKRAVEVLVRELDDWHASQNPPNRKDDIEVTLEELGSRSSPPNAPASETEKRLLWELKRLQKELTRKKDPQISPKQHGQPEDTLKMAVSGLTRSANELMEAAGQKNPTKESLLDPALLMTKMVSTLLDLVDSLFVTKYPMRSQVHSFCSTLVENVVAYKDQSKTDDVSSLRNLSTQTPALLSAAEVMVEQCHIRSQNVKESKQMSIARHTGLQELDVFRPGKSPAGSPAANRKKALEKKVSVDFEICCIVCTSVAVDQKTKKMMSKGSELLLNVSPSTTVRDLRKTLCGNIGLPLEHIEIKCQGDDVLSDDTKLTPNNPVPYFVFNLCEPTEEEIHEIKKNERKKNRIKIEDINWSKISNPVAVALFDYEALGEGEDGNLAFDEGDILEIIEKSPDGWWTGLLDGQTGVFPASFVEEIQQPKTKEEQRRLVKRFQQQANEEQSQINNAPLERSASHPGHFQSSAAHTRSASPKLHGLKILKRSGNSGSDISPKTSPRESPSPTKKAPKLDRHSSEPHFSQFEQPKEGKGHRGGKKIGLFKKKTGNYSPIFEEEMDRDKERLLVSEHHPKPRSPILSSPARRKKFDPDFVWKEADHGGPAANGGPVAPHSPGRPLVRPASSPKLMPKGTGSVPGSTPASGMGPGQNSGRVSPGQRRPKRPPPPVPRPYAAQHGKSGLSTLLQRQMSNESNKEELRDPSPSLSPPLMMKPAPESPPLITISPELQQEDEASVQARREEENALAPPPGNIVKGSSSMEELFKNLQEFDDLNGGQVNELGVQKEEGSRDYATIPRSELPVMKVDEKEEEEEEKEKEEEEMKVNENEFMPQPEIGVSESKPESESRVSPLSQRKTPAEPPKSTLVSKPNPASKKPEIAAKKPEIAGKKPEIAGKKPMFPPSRKNTSPPLPRPLQNGLDGEKKSGNPQPVPPPRTKRKPMSKIMKERMMMYEKQEEEKQQETGGLDPSVSSKPHPHTDAPQKPPRAREATKDKVTPRLKVLETETGQCASAPVSRTASPVPASSDVLGPPGKLLREGSTSTDALGQRRGSNPLPVSQSHSPVVMRRTNTIVSKPSHSDQDDCTGIGKEGVLHKEGTSSRDWKARYFKLQECHLVYFETDSTSANTKPLGQIPVKRMQEAVPIGEKNGFQRFAINMHYDTSVVLGSHTRTEMEDWVESINKVIKISKSNGGRSSSYSSAYKTAIKCITYLSDGGHPAKDRVFVSGGENTTKVDRWLESIDRGEDADLSDMPDAITAVGLLKALLKEGKIGCIVQHKLAKELCDLANSTSPVSVLGSKLEELPNDSRGLLKQLLRLFGQVLEHSDKNHTKVSDLNRVFGPLIFEKVALTQLEPLLAYLISTCELIIS